ncbi:MAG: hypothetical protein HQK78_13700, partial [Desulfobacterales bacterium]|nr:hypothetical protein [Desulfobacterales bacterium]
LRKLSYNTVNRVDDRDILAAEFNINISLVDIYWDTIMTFAEKTTKQEDTRIIKH